MTCNHIVPMLAVALSVVAARQAEAHFLFIRITPPAEGGRAAEVYFSERAVAGDPRFVDKVAHTSLWLQTVPGEFKSTRLSKAADRLRAHLPSEGPLAVFGFCEYGVLARPGEKPFLLRYYPKAIAGAPEELNRFQPRREAAMEIVATLTPDEVELAALVDGKPLPRATFHIVDSSLAEEEVEADDEGRAKWKPAANGAYSIYTKHVLPWPGEVGGQHYDEIRQFATLWLTWPLVRAQADQKAVQLFEEAVAARAQWRDFPGFRAEITGSIDRREFSGSVTVKADGSVTLASDDDATSSWLEEQLESIAMHRAAPKRSSGDPSPRLWFGDEDESHPLGRLLIFDGGRFASSYRVKDRQITVVNRVMGEENMTITVLDNEVNADGDFLPRSYTVQYWDEVTGKLLRSEAVNDRWRRVGNFDLPAEHAVTHSSDAGQSVRSFTLSKHSLLN
jgi:hypothetical protein